MINCLTVFNLILFIFNLIHKLFSISNVSKCVFLAKNVTVYHERVPQSYHKLVVEFTHVKLTNIFKYMILSTSSGNGKM